MAMTIYLRTVRLIEWVLSVMSTVGGVVNLTIVLASSANYVGILWSILLILAGALVIVGLLVNNTVLKRNGWFLLFMVRVFQVIGIIVAVGLDIGILFYTITLLLIVCVLYYHNSL